VQSIWLRYPCGLPLSEENGEKPHLFGRVVDSLRATHLQVQDIPHPLSQQKSYLERYRQVIWKKQDSILQV
jgi:hypothetical protein